MHFRIHSESVTRFISCMISRNSSVTHFRIDPPKKGVRNGSSWKRVPSGASARLFSQHAGDVSSLPSYPRGAAMVHKHTVHQIPEVRARAAARGPARSMQPGHIEFGTGNWSLWECLDGIMNRQIAHGRIRRHIPIGSKNSLTCIWRPHP
eukprot:COSAG02_NODE_8122_length_2699_cov_7.290769_2_plen_150_part_00